MQATIKLEYENAQTATAIAKAISPDNLQTPEGLTVHTKNQENLVVTKIEIEDNLATLVFTIDDLLEATTAAEKTLRTLNKAK